MSARAEVMIDRAQGEVFDGFIDDDALVAFCQKLGPFAAIAEAKTQGEVKAGAVRAVRMSDGMELEETIAEHERPQSHAYGWADPPLPLGALIRSADARWTFDEDSGGTRVTWRYAFTLRSALLWPIGKLVSIGFGRWMQAALDRGKASIEG